MYVVCPFDRLDECGSRLNSAALIDRQGTVTRVYDKHFPYGLEELRHYLERSRSDIIALRDREKHL